MAVRRVCLFFLAFQCLFYSLFSSPPTLESLSLEEKIGQLLIVHFHGEEANDEARQLIQELYIGGIIYYNWANGLDCPAQVARLSKGLQELAAENSHAVPLIITVDQEGGVVNRLKRGFTIFPSNYAIGLTAAAANNARESARIMGEELKAVGINLNLAPAADVYSNRNNPVIGIRSFSADPRRVALLASSAIQGYHAAGIASAVKHFPGHGDSALDSHEALPVIQKNRVELEDCELLPYRTLADQADVILTAHLLFPALDPDNCASFSKKIITGLLRKELQFQGVVMTDSLAMQGILNQCTSIDEAVIKCLEAGHDCVLLGGKQLLATQKGFEFSLEEIRAVHQSLVEAVKTGRLSEKRVDEAVSRLLALKEKIAVPSFEQIGTAEHHAFAQGIAREALHLVKGHAFLPLCLTQEEILAIAPDFLKDELEQTSWTTLKSKILYFEGLNPSPEFWAKVERANASFCLFFSYQAWNTPGQQTLFRILRQNSNVLLTIVVRDPLDNEVVVSSDIVLNTYGPAPCSLQAAYDFLIGIP